MLLKSCAGLNAFEKVFREEWMAWTELLQDSWRYAIILTDVITHDPLQIIFFFYNCYEDQKALGLFPSLDLAQCVNFLLYKFKIKTLKYISLFQVRLLKMPLGTEINGQVFR